MPGQWPGQLIGNRPRLFGLGTGAPRARLPTSHIVACLKQVPSPLGKGYGAIQWSAFAVPFAQGWTGEARGRHCEKCSRMWLARHQRTGEDAGSREVIRVCIRISPSRTGQGRAGQQARWRNATPFALRVALTKTNGQPTEGAGMPERAFNAAGSLQQPTGRG